ncbi:hypothetical protein B0H12DRAFT_1148917 [Mycena haematopus]|nr:hypothetical protein B0H12DRAFT_1148917 [Mycena haematopus]
MAKIRAGRVVVVGCGGVGSWAAVMLIRSGIGHIRLRDAVSAEPARVAGHGAMGGGLGVRPVQVWPGDGGEKLLEGAD